MELRVEGALEGIWQYSIQYAYSKSVWRHTILLKIWRYHDGGVRCILNIRAVSAKAKNDGD